MNPLILVVDDEPDVETLFRQQFRRDLRADRFKMEFAQSGDIALQRIADAADVSLILILSDTCRPASSGASSLPFSAVRRQHGRSQRVHSSPSECGVSLCS